MDIVSNQSNDRVRRRGRKAASAPARRHRGLVAGGATVALAFGVVAPSAISAATTTPKALTLLQQGLKYYKGKTLTMIIPTNSGQTYDIAERLTLPYLEKYLGATINPVNLPGGVTLTGQDDTAHSAPNGLTFGIMTTGTDAYDLDTGIVGLNFNPEREAFLAGNDPQEQVLIAQPSSGYTSLAQIRSTATTSHPLVNMTLTGGSEFGTALLMRSFGIPVTYVTGFPNAASETSGWIQNDGATLLINLATAGPLMPSKAVPLMLQTPAPKGSIFSSSIASTPTFAQLIAKYPPKLAGQKEAASAYEAWIAMEGFTYFAPSATPAADVAALQAAFKFAFTNPNWKQQATAQAIATGYLSGATMKGIFVKALTLLPKALKLVGMSPS